MTVEDFIPHGGFLKTNNAFPEKKNYLWIFCDICGHRVNVYESISNLWLCSKCATTIKDVEKRITAVHCDICNNCLTYCKTKTQQWWECRKCQMITEKTKLK